MWWWIGLASAQEVTPPVVDEMHQRFEALTASRDAVVQGDLAAATSSAAALLDLGSKGIPKRWKPYLASLEAAARELRSAPDLRGAGAAVGKVAVACAECHEAQGGGPRLDHADEVPPQQWSEGQNMPLHQWATDWMWLGLLANDDEAWNRGATELDRMPIALRFDDAPPDGTRELEQGVYVLAGRARQVDDLAERGELYGQLVTTCSQCHHQHRDAQPAPTPAPAPVKEAP